MKNRRFPSSILLTCKSIWQITFSGWTFFQLFPQIWNQRKILRILNTHMPNKNKKIFWGHWVHIWVYVRTSRMQIRKKWLNQMKNFFNKHFWEYYLASFCWWISSSCENHCTLLDTYPLQFTTSLKASMWFILFSFLVHPIQACLPYILYSFHHHLNMYKTYPLQLSSSLKAWMTAAIQCPWDLPSSPKVCLLNILYSFHTVKSSNFVILLSEKNFFCQTFFWLPHNIFWYWSLYRRGLCILIKQFWP